MPYIAGGEKVTLTGEWTFHQDYGPQFKVEFFEKNMDFHQKTICIWPKIGYNKVD